MIDQATSTRPEPATGGSSQAADPQEEILRLRDLLVGKDAELGALRGRLAELEASSARLVNLATRVRSRVPRFVLLTGSALRRRRRQRG